MTADYRGFLAGVLAVLTIYATMSCWPAILALLAPASGSTPSSPIPLAPGSAAPQALPAPTASAPVAAGSAGRQSAGMSQASGPAATLAQALSQAQAISAADSDKAPVHVRWQVLDHNVQLLEKPGGPGLMPPAASHAPLTICQGSSLQVLDQRDNWAKVRSRSLSVGWVSLDQLSLRD